MKYNSRFFASLRMTSALRSATAAIFLRSAVTAISLRWATAASSLRWARGGKLLDIGGDEEQEQQQPQILRLRRAKQRPCFAQDDNPAGDSIPAGGEGSILGQTRPMVYLPTTDVELDFQDHRHDQGSTPGLLLDQALEVDADFFLHHAVIGLLLAAEAVERLEDGFAGFVGDVGASEAAHHHFRRALHNAGALVDGEDGEHDTVF